MAPESASLLNSTVRGLLVPGATGVMYSNQCAGHASLHREVEGHYVPLRGECDDLIDYFWLVEGGYSWTGLSPVHADEVDATLADYGFSSAIRVDRTRLRLSCAAWVWVATTQIATQDCTLQSIQNGTGILTWDDGTAAAERVRNARWKNYVG